jgi:dinuclear metal center YbgI/SA1388 family protein
MITLSQLQLFLDNLLVYDKSFDLPKIDTYMADGLMVKGALEVKKIGIGVSASLKLFEMAEKAKCQALITHHSLTYPSVNRYDRIFQNRYAHLIKNNISLFGYHFLLDSHPEIGHNAQIIKLLDGEIVSPYLFHGYPWGYLGKIKKVSRETVIKKLKPFASPEMKVHPYGTNEIETVVAVSGSGYPYVSDIQFLTDNKVDLYISGATAEWVREVFREAEINFISGGHYHTERLGLLALEKIIKESLPVETEFLELENEA